MKNRVNGCAAIARARAAREIRQVAEAARTSRKLNSLLAILDFYEEEAVDEFFTGGFVDPESVACAEDVMSDPERGAYERMIAEEIIRRSKSW